VLIAIALAGGRLHPKNARRRWFQRVWMVGIASATLGTAVAIAGTQIDLSLTAAVALNVLAGVAGASAFTFLLAIVATHQVAAEKDES